MSDMERDIGRLEAQVEAQNERMVRMESKLDVVVDFMSQSKGSWKTLIAVGSLAMTLAGMIGALISKLLPWFKPH